jgi:hypothetical protein
LNFSSDHVLTSIFRYLLMLPASPRLHASPAAQA